MHKTMVSVASLEKIEVIRSQEFMPSKARLKFLKKMIILGPKTAILGPHFWWSGGQAPGAPTLDPPLIIRLIASDSTKEKLMLNFPSELTKISRQKLETRL